MITITNAGGIALENRIFGSGRVMANGIRRASGYDVNGESFSDAWNKGYQEYLTKTPE